MSWNKDCKVLSPSQLSGATKLAFRVLSEKGHVSLRLHYVYGGPIGGPTCFRLGTMGRPRKTHTHAHSRYVGQTLRLFLPFDLYLLFLLSLFSPPADLVQGWSCQLRNPPIPRFATIQSIIF